MWLVMASQVHDRDPELKYAVYCINCVVKNKIGIRKGSYVVCGGGWWKGGGSKCGPDWGER